ncbi:hypothetical protein EP331_09370 [bacterium]|nr:MAG: hypothetical protein EP331_09370 [bacterium]
MKTFIQSAILLFATVIIASAQNRAEKEMIKSSGEYYWGEAIANSSKEASDLALSYLTQSIAVQVSSTFQNVSKEVTSGRDVNFDEFSENILKTYSTATLKNVETLRAPSNGQIEVFHYIKKSEVAKIYEERKRLVYNIYEQALKFEDENNFGYALKWYNFSIILMNSVPEQNIVYQNINLTTEISARINKILKGVRFSLESDNHKNEKERELVFSVTVDDKPAQYLEYSFFDGYDLVNAQATDGSAVVYLVGSSVEMENLNLNVRYSFYESRNEINEVGQLWDLVNKPAFKNNLSVNITKERERLRERKREREKAKQAAMASGSADDAGTTESFGELTVTTEVSIEPVVKQQIMGSLQKAIELFKGNNLTAIAALYPNDPFLSSKFTSLVKLNNTQLVDIPLEGSINKTYDGFEFRRASAINKYPSISKQTQEYLVFDFDKTGNLTDVNFGIIDDLYQKFVTQAQYGNDWKNREVIIKFMERYRTAYMTRNMDMLANMFAEEAVIIVGRVLKKGQQKKNYDYVPIGDDQPDVEYLRYTKDEYLKRQKNVFDAQRDIFLGFSNFNITRKNNQEGVYGISLRQHYTATNYADEGYLFLLVDFNDEQPQIYVRSWQPQEWVEESLIKLANFNINK